MPKRIFITGASGLLGSTLVRALKTTAHDVITERIEITNAAACLDFGSKQGTLDWIIHTAGEIDVSFCEKEQSKCYATNVLGTKNIRDLAKVCGARMLYTSTASVFAGDKGNYTEDDVPYPKNFYSLSKLLGEQFVWEYEGGTVLRINIIGIHPDGSRGRNLIEWLVNSIVGNKDLTLFTDLFINPLSNLTLAEIIVRIIGKESWNERIVHLGSKNVMSKAMIGEIALSHFPQYRGRISRVASDTVGNSLFNPKQLSLNSARAEQAIGINMPQLESEIEKVLKVL